MGGLIGLMVKWFAGVSFRGYSSLSRAVVSGRAERYITRRVNGEIVVSNRVS